MTDEKERSGRIARNESFTHFGNVFYAVVAGTAGAAMPGQPLLRSRGFAAGMALAVRFISDDHVNYEAAREGSNGDDPSRRSTIRDLLRDKRILTFTAAVVLFNVSNASTLPLVAQILSKNNHGAGAAWQVAAAVFVAELVMIFVAKYAGGYVAKRAGFNASFAGLSAAAVAGGSLYQLRMPETRGDNPQ